MRYSIPEKGSPWSRPLRTGKGSEVKSSNMSVVSLLSSRLSSHSVYSLGIPLFLMLWMSLLMSTLGKAALTSRKRVDATCPLRQASLTVFVSRWIESVVVHPGLAPKWFAGRISSFSHIVTISVV